MADKTSYVLSLSYGKDSLACLEAIRLLGMPLDRIVHSEVWATDIIPADLPPMVEFKAKADKVIKERYGIEVEHVCAMKNGEKLTYEKLFYYVPKRRQPDRGGNDWSGLCQGFPLSKTSYCKKLKKDEITFFSSRNFKEEGKINTVQYLGIAADEPERIKRHTTPGKVLPLVEIGWNEAYCRKWCEENDLLSPIYETAARGGCWFCHNQSLGQLRELRRNYPELWSLLLKWDRDSPATFHQDGHTVHDFDRRFQAEDEGHVPADRRFRWKMLDL